MLQRWTHEYYFRLEVLVQADISADLSILYARFSGEDPYNLFQLKVTGCSEIPGQNQNWNGPHQNQDANEKRAVQLCENRSHQRRSQSPTNPTQTNQTEANSWI